MYHCVVYWTNNVGSTNKTIKGKRGEIADGISDTNGNAGRLLSRKQEVTTLLRADTRYYRWSGFLITSMRCVRIHSPLVHCSPIRQEALCPVAKGRVITRRLVRRLGDTIAAPGFSLIGLRLTTSAPGCLRAIVEKWPREEETHKSPWEVADTLRTRRFVGLHAKTVVASLSLGRSSLRRSCWICRSPRETRGMKSTWVRRGWSHMDQ